VLMALTATQIEKAVYDKIRSILDERGEKNRALCGTDSLNATLGLTSLDLAFIVAELEVELGADPFARLVPITSVRSVDDLVRAYRIVFDPNAREPEQDPSLAEAVQRAKERRTRQKRK
jgi:acyl carrier protein